MTEQYLGGVHAVKTMFERYPRHIKGFWLAKGSKHTDWFVEMAKQHGIELQYCDKPTLDQWLPGVNHQGVAVLCRQLPSLGLSDLLDQCFKREGAPLLLVLDCIQDPQNLGACLRSAAAFGVDGVIIPKDRAVGVTPTVIKVAAGGAAIVPVVRVTNLARSMRQLKERGVWLYGTSEYAGEGVASADVRLPVAWVMGNERKGLSRTVMQQCDALYSIETSGFSTLNIATSTGICLYYTHLNRL